MQPAGNGINNQGINVETGGYGLGVGPVKVQSAITVSAIADYDGKCGGLGGPGGLIGNDDVFAGFSNFGLSVDIEPQEKISCPQ